MCGIAGFCDVTNVFTEHADYWIKDIEKMRDTLTHRGPDDKGSFIGKHICLGHRRLSIRDIQKGGQPMTRTLNNITATIVYNGELYNVDEIKSLLSTYNIHYTTDSDTEVILYSYLAFGPDIFRYLNGIFAFCISTDNGLLIVRDHLGVKPLYYTYDEKSFVFGSEPKAIFAHGIKPEIDRNGMCEIFALGPAHTPGNGVFKNLYEVLPGHFVEVKYYNEKITVKDNCFWKLKAKEHMDSYNDTVETTSFLITDSIRRQLVSDVPVCSFLSGGLDSSLVSAICMHFLAKEGKDFNTFSFDFKDNSKNFVANSFQSTMDRPYVDIMVEHINSNHHYLECTNQIQYDYLFKAVDARDMPCMADVESSLVYFCSEVAKTNSVALTGECADEIFGGYPWFHNEKFLNYDGFPWSTDSASRTLLLKDDFIDFLNIEEYIRNAYTTSLEKTPHLQEEKGDKLRMRQICWLNIRWFMQTLLARMDRASMFSGLETRVPFADYRILEYVYNVPWSMKHKDGQTKNLLIEAGKKYLPKQVLYRKKSPYPKTYDPNYEKLLSSHLLEILESKSSNLSLVCDVSKVRNFINSPKDYGRPWYGQLMAGPQMLAYMIMVAYWMDNYNLTL